MAARLSAAATASLSAAEQAAAAKPVAKRLAMGWLRSLVDHSPDIGELLGILTHAVTSSVAVAHSLELRPAVVGWVGDVRWSGVAELEQLAELVRAVPTMRHSTVAVALLGNPPCDLRDMSPGAEC